MSDEEARANAAIVGARGSYVTKEERAEILTRDGEATARLVDEIYGEAMRPPESWGPGETSMDTGLDAMHARLRVRYSWLDAAAHATLNAMFLMTWK